MEPKKNDKTKILRQPLSHADFGFTLIEVLIAFAILSTLLVVIIQSYSDTSYFLQRTRLRESAQRITYFELFKIEREGINSTTPKTGKFPSDHELAGGLWKIIETKENFMEIFPVTKVTFQITWLNGKYTNSFESSILLK